MSTDGPRGRRVAIPADFRLSVPHLPPEVALQHRIPLPRLHRQRRQLRLRRQTAQDGS